MARPRTIGILALVLAAATVIWVILSVIIQMSAPPIETLTDKIAWIRQLDAIYGLNYLNASLITLLAVATFAGLYIYCQDDQGLWSLIAFSFVPMYGIANAIVYLSQVALVPDLLRMYSSPETHSIAETLLAITIHEWAGSAAGFVNALAYALLGIPSIIFGILMFRKAHELHFGGVLLALSGVCSIAALAGVLVKSQGLMQMTIIAGALFLIALIALGVPLLRFPEPDPAKTVRSGDKAYSTG